MKFLILGHGKHGKDAFADIINKEFGFRFRSSSEFACERAVYPILKNIYGYNSVESCINDRRAHRAEWRALISAYNLNDKSRLCRELLAVADCYVGMRCPLEYEASKDLFDAVFWIDASSRRGPDKTMQIDFRPWEMIKIDNNGTLSELASSAATQCAKVFQSLTA